MKPCRCGHPAQLHEHHRLGTDCPKCACRRYQRRRWWHRVPRGEVADLQLWEQELRAVTAHKHPAAGDMRQAGPPPNRPAPPPGSPPHQPAP